MKSKYLLIIASLLFMVLRLIGCAMQSSSTGIIGKQQVSLPSGVPSRVAVIPFWGDIRINIQATDQFMVGLPMLGFITMERQQINAIIGEFQLQDTDYIASETRKRLKELLGVDGLFLGSITAESSAS